MSNTSSVQSMIAILVAVLIIAVIALIGTVVIYFLKNKKQKQAENIAPITGNKKEELENKGQNKQSIFKFMEFDKVEDNMIVQKNGMRFLMVVQCQGVNYDLMSGQEKVAVEEGFLQFLNTLKHPIQLYIQTRTVNLEDSINTYKSRVNEIEYLLRKREMEYQRKVESGNYSKQELDKDFYELTKQRNLYEYGQDIIYNTQMMSLNKNVLNKQYYIIIPYYPDDISSDYDKEEIKNMAFSELYTRAQSVIRTLASCEVTGKILNSNELVDLLYVAYNRDESEVFGLDKAMQAGYDEMYSTAPDVLDKKMAELDKLIEQKAIEKANEVVMQVKTEKQRKVEQTEKTIDELIAEAAKLILKNNAPYIGVATAGEAINRIKEESKEEGGMQDVS